MRDKLYEEIMTNAWNEEKGFFCQSYEDKVRHRSFSPIPSLLAHAEFKRNSNL